MRTPGWSLTILLLIAPALSAQQQPPTRGAANPPVLAVPPAVPAPDPRLMPLLQQWAQKMKSIQALQADVVRLETDTVIKQVDEFYGRILFLRPDRAELYLIKKTNPPQDPKNLQVYERFLCTGPFLYEFVPQNKMIRAHQLPRRPNGQLALDDTFLGFLVGMEVQEVQRRYDVQLIKQDTHYDYLQVRPLLPGDKTEFTEARLALYNQKQAFASLPRQMTLIQPNGKEVQWNVNQINPAAQIPANFFVKPQLPQGWQFVDMAPTAAPAPPGAIPRQGGAAVPPIAVPQRGGK